MSYADEMRRLSEFRQARRDAGKPLLETPEEISAREKEDDDRLEREIQRECVKIYRANGAQVYETSQKKAPKGVTPGIADLIVFFPHHLVFHEVKTPTGEQEPSQRNFQEDCIFAGVEYVIGGVAVAEKVCLQQHLSTRG